MNTPQEIVNYITTFLDYNDQKSFTLSSKNIMFDNWNHLGEYISPDHSEGFPEKDPGVQNDDFVVPVKRKKTRHCKTRRRRFCNLGCSNLPWSEKCDECMTFETDYYNNDFYDEYYGTWFYYRDGIFEDD